MPPTDPKPDRKRDDAPEAPASREARLAAALRENLRRRKSLRHPAEPGSEPSSDGS